jgi:hypothetical protein
MNGRPVDGNSAFFQFFSSMIAKIEKTCNNNAGLDRVL